MSLRERIRPWMKEPLVHFLFAGFLVFLFFAWRGTDPDPADRRIVVSEDQVQRLTAIWSQSWQRPPSPDEIDGLIRDYIKEEIYYREALRLGLESDDLIVRRRMRAKMEALANAGIDDEVPDEAELKQWFNANAARYAPDARLSFDQVFAGNDSARARAMLPALQTGRKVAATPITLPAAIETADAATIDRDFGEGFAKAVAAAPVGQWSGPVSSGFGLHLVRLRAAEPIRAPDFNSVRQQVENDWRAATRVKREAAAYQTLLDGYDIVIEKPD